MSKSLPRSLVIVVAALSACAVEDGPLVDTRLVVGQARGAAAVVVVSDDTYFDAVATEDDGRFSVEVPVGRALAVRLYDGDSRSLGHAVFPATRDEEVFTQVVPPGHASVELGEVLIEPDAPACVGRPTSRSPLTAHDHDDDGIVDADDDDALAFARMIDWCGPPGSVR